MTKQGPATRVESNGLDELALIARRLNTASDDLNASLRQIEMRLSEIGIGISRFVPLPDTRIDLSDGHPNEEWSEHQLGYDRVAEGWILMIRRAHFTADPAMEFEPEDCWEFDEVKPLLRSSRDMRIKAVTALPSLLNELKGAGEEILEVVDQARQLAGASGKRIQFEFGETEASNAFWDRNESFFPAFMRLVDLLNKTFGREWKPLNRVQDLCFNLGESCRRDFLEIAFLAVNGHGLGALKLLRGLYERAVTIEYLRLNPDKAERFVRFGAIQEYRAVKAAVDLVGEEEFNRVMLHPVSQYADLYKQVQPEFQVSDCKKCDTKRLAVSWDIDFASMVKRVGQPYQSLYLAAYATPNLHVHATLSSAFSHEANVGTLEERNIDDAEVTLIHATLILILAIQSQSELFSLGFDADTRKSWDDVSAVWQNRREAAIARKTSPSKK